MSKCPSNIPLPFSLCSSLYPKLSCGVDVELRTPWNWSYSHLTQTSGWAQYTRISRPWGQYQRARYECVQFAVTSRPAPLLGAK